MNKLKMHSPDLVQENIDRIKDLFPNCVTEVKDASGNLKPAIDFDQLKQELSDHIVEGPQERYHLNWPGKREALLTANAPIAKTLRPCREESVDFDTTQNLFIEGDNLDTLKLLQESYLGKIKMIYIDPPYNTGNDFIYDDDFSETTEKYLQKSNQKDESGNRLVANSDANGRFHSDWLSMLYPRLKLARNLLSDDGFIIVSIDDAECKNLQYIVSEIFGSENLIAALVYDKNRKNDAKFFSVGHEYMIVYAKSKQHLVSNGFVLREEKEGLKDAKILFNKLMKNHNGDLSFVQELWRKHFSGMSNENPVKKLGRFSKISKRGPYRDDGNISWPGGNGPKYEVIHPNTKKPCKIPDGGWRYSKPEKFWDEVKKGRVVFGPDEHTLPRQCRYLFEGEGQVMTSVHYSYAQTATLELMELMGDRVFQNPKNWSDISRLINYMTGDKEGIILDFFAGSATTAHAVMKLNAEDGGNHKFIMVQIPEACKEKSEAFKAGYNTISEISKERIRRAGKKIKEENPTTATNLDTGFRVLKVDSSNMSDVYYTPDNLPQEQLQYLTDNIKEDRTDEDLLFQVMLDLGIGLTHSITTEEILGNTVFEVNKSDYAKSDIIACFAKNGEIDEAFCKELAGRKPLRAVFRDAGFQSDDIKINVAQIFKQLSPHTDIKTI